MQSSTRRGSKQRECEGQLCLALAWLAPTERIAVSCPDCGWRGRRPRRAYGRRPCPRCGAQVERGRWPVSALATRPVAGNDELWNKIRQLRPEQRQKRPSRRRVSAAHSR
jgi:endogenous inhibitor of DNA gyrase (YacG/DUF329 family)